MQVNIKGAVKATIRFFIINQGYGFAETADGKDVFIHVSKFGHCNRVVDGSHNFMLFDLSKEEASFQLHKGAEILILAMASDTVKGPFAIMWTQDNFIEKARPCFVMEYQETETWDKPVESQNKEKRMWTTTEVCRKVQRYVPIFVGSREDALALEASSPHTRSVVEYDPLNGFIRKFQLKEKEGC